MVMIPTNAYKRLRVSYIHSKPPTCFGRTCVVILREVHYKGYITDVSEQMHKCRYVLKGKILIKFL